MGEYIKLYRVPGGDLHAHFIALAVPFRDAYAQALRPDAGAAHDAALRSADGTLCRDDSGERLYPVPDQPGQVTTTPFARGWGPWFTDELDALDAVIAHQSMAALASTPDLLPPLAKVFAVFVSGLIAEHDWPGLRYPHAHPLGGPLFRSAYAALADWLERFPNRVEARVVLDALQASYGSRPLLPAPLLARLRAAWPAPLGTDDTPFQLEQVVLIEAGSVQRVARWLDQHRPSAHRNLHQSFSDAATGDAILFCRY